MRFIGTTAALMHSPQINSSLLRLNTSGHRDVQSMTDQNGHVSESKRDAALRPKPFHQTEAPDSTCNSEHCSTMRSLPAHRYCHRNFDGITTGISAFPRRMRNGPMSSEILCPHWMAWSA